MSTKNCGGGFTHSTQVGFDKDQSCGDVAEVSSCLGKEIFDLTVDVWDDPGCDGDNVVRVFNKDECVYSEGYFYWSKEDMNVDMPPSAKWTEGVTKCEMLKPYNLVSCSGESLSSGDSVASCKDLADAIDSIPPLEKCGGGDVDGPLVQCDQLSTSDFMIDPGTGTVTVNTKDLCIVTEVNTDPCATYQPLYTTVGADGCARLISSENLRLDIARVRANRADITGNAVVMMPQNPTDTTTFYTLTDLNADIAAGTVDAAKLESTRIFTHDIDIPCDETYVLRIENLTEFDPAMAGKSTYIIRLDGNWMPSVGGGTNPRNIGNFTSFGGGDSTTLTQYLTGGTHTFEMFVVGHNGSGNAAQVAVRTNATGSPILDIERRTT